MTVTSTTRRGAALAAGAALFLAAAGGARAQSVPAPGTDDATLYAQAKTEGKILYYNGSTADRNDAFIALFNKKYPGITITAQRFANQAQYQRFAQESQAGQYLADLVSISDESAMQDLIKLGDIADWKIPTIDRFPDYTRLGTYSIAPYVGLPVVAYLASKVTPAEADILRASWKGILDPRFKGRFGVDTQNCGLCYAPINMFLNPKTAKDYGPDFLKQVAAQKPTVYADINILANQVVAGENDIAYWLGEPNAFTSYSTGAPIEWVYPDPTPVGPSIWVGISKNAPHPAAARLFYDWQFSEDGARAYQAAFGAATVMSGVADTRAVTKESWYKAPKTLYAIDPAQAAGAITKDLAAWQAALAAAK